MKYYIGLDQGGTKTAAIVCGTNGRILGAGYEAGLVDVYFNDTDGQYIKRIKSACEKACAQAGIKLPDISAVCGGLNGADWDFEYPILAKKLAAGLGIEDVIVLNDCVAALRGGTDELECGVVCAGSGLNIAVKRHDGEKIIYGYFINDAHQGAGALGTAALRKIMESYIGICGHTALTRLILEYTGHDNAEKLLMSITSGQYRLEPKVLAPLVLKAYVQGDKETVSIVNPFAEEIAMYVTAGIRRLEISNNNMPIVFSGSVFKGDGLMLGDKIFSHITKSRPNMRMIYPRYEPVCGAALTLLDREFGGVVPDTVKENFDKTAAGHGLLWG